MGDSSPKRSGSLGRSFQRVLDVRLMQNEFLRVLPNFVQIDLRRNRNLFREANRNKSFRNPWQLLNTLLLAWLSLFKAYRRLLCYFFFDESRNRELKQVNLFWYRSCWLSFTGGKVPKVGAHIPAMGSLVLYLILKKVLLRNEILFKTEESMIYVNDDFHAIILILFFCQPAHHTI